MVLIFPQKNTEYNPKLSEATPTTRVAYVKFMATTMRRESNADQNDRDNDVDNKKDEISAQKLRKSILRTAPKPTAVQIQSDEILFIKKYMEFVFSIHFSNMDWA